MPARIRLKKGRDGPATLTLVRPDGTRTWSRLHPFSPVHDLLHYAVETTLGFGEAFFGLLASGWDIDTFGQPGVPASPHSRAARGARRPHAGPGERSPRGPAGGRRLSDPHARPRGRARAAGEAGVRLLRNEALDAGGLRFVGLDDLWSPRFDPAPVLARHPADPATLVLCHNPDAADRPAWAGYPRGAGS